MHFLDAWTRLAALDLARLLAAPFFVALSIALPGRRAAALSCLGLAAAALIVPGVGAANSPAASSWFGALTPAALIARIAWTLLWLALAATVARATEDPPSDPSARRGGLESGTVGLLLGFALLLLLVAAVARQNLEERSSREASYALLLIVLGLVHLMLRRHVLRATIAFGAMGMGLDRIARAADAEQLPGSSTPALAVWIATALAFALVARIARLRLRGGGGAWVSGAHDLHD